jgi:hypothetical protein
MKPETRETIRQSVAAMVERYPAEEVTRAEYAARVVLESFEKTFEGFTDEQLAQVSRSIAVLMSSLEGCAARDLSDTMMNTFNGYLLASAVKAGLYELQEAKPTGSDDHTGFYL